MGILVHANDNLQLKCAFGRMIGYELGIGNSVFYWESSVGLSSEQLNQFWKSAKRKLDAHQCAPISSIMTADVITLNRQSTLQDALMLFREHRLRHLVVVDEQTEIQGIFTKRDLIAVEGPGLDRSIVSVANTEVQTVDQNACIRHVATLMLTHKIGCVPIVSGNKRLVGIVTEADFVRAFALNTRCGCGVMNA